MPLLNSQPDLNGKIYSLKELEFARKFFENEIPKHNHNWLKHPAGGLSTYWMRDDADAACYLIDLCFIIQSIRNVVDPRSAEILNKKIKALLTLEEKQYEDLFTELDIISAWSKLADRLDLEPVSEEQPRANGENRNVDFQIHWKDEICYFEVTTLNFQKLNDFVNDIGKLHDFLTNIIMRAKKRRIVEFEFPLSFRFSFFKQEDLQKLVGMILDSEEGEIRISLKSNVGFARWRYLPHVLSRDQIKYLPVSIRYWTLDSPGTRDNITIGYRERDCIQWFTYGYNYDTPVAFETCPNQFTVEDEEDLVKSLRNTLKLKRKQFRLNKPIVLIMTPSSIWLPQDKILETIHKRIWPNPDYHWLSAIFIHVYNRQFDSLDKPWGRYYTLFNPNATYQISQTLRDRFKNP